MINQVIETDIYTFLCDLCNCNLTAVLERVAKFNFRDISNKLTFINLTSSNNDYLLN